MFVKYALPLAVVLAVGIGGSSLAQGGAGQTQALTKQQLQLLERNGSVAANLEAAYAAAIDAHAADVQGQDAIALNQVYAARSRLMNIQALRISEPELDRALGDLMTMTTLAQRRLTARSQASEQALKDLVLRFSQTMALLPQLGGGGGGQALLTQKLATEWVGDSYQSLASAQGALARGNRKAAAVWLEEAQSQLQAAKQAPGSDRVKDLLGAVEPAVELARTQVSQETPAALDAATRAIEQVATRLSSTR